MMKETGSVSFEWQLESFYLANRSHRFSNGFKQCKITVCVHSLFIILSISSPTRSRLIFVLRASFTVFERFYHTELASFGEFTCISSFFAAACSSGTRLKSKRLANRIQRRTRRGSSLKVSCGARGVRTIPSLRSLRPYHKVVQKRMKKIWSV